MIYITQYVVIRKLYNDLHHRVRRSETYDCHLRKNFNLLAREILVSIHENGKKSWGDNILRKMLWVWG